MTRPFLLAQLSDPHIGADWGEGDPVARLAAVIDAVRAMHPAPDAVLVSGDLADHGTDAEYEQVLELLARLPAPLFVLPGNHDDRRGLHRHFGVPGRDGEPVQYSVDLGPFRLVVLDRRDQARMRASSTPPASTGSTPNLPERRRCRP